MAREYWLPQLRPNHGSSSNLSSAGAACPRRRASRATDRHYFDRAAKCRHLAWELEEFRARLVDLPLFFPFLRDVLFSIENTLDSINPVKADRQG